MTKLINAWWLVRLRVRPVQRVLWGGRPELDVQIGSPEDARLERWRRIVAQRQRAARQLNEGMVRIALSFTDAFAPAVREAQRQMAAIGRAMAAGGPRG